MCRALVKNALEEDIIFYSVFRGIFEFKNAKPYVAILIITRCMNSIYR